MNDALKGQAPLGFLVLNAGCEKSPRSSGGGRGGSESVALVRERIGPVASFKTAVVVERLPKTRSGIDDPPRHSCRRSRTASYNSS